MNIFPGETSLRNTATPLEEVYWEPFLSAGVKLYIKRDDLIHPVISGNKWRKLKHLIFFALENGYTQLVSFGGAYSNHLPALAVACEAFGLRSVGFVRGEELSPESNHQLRVCAEAGMSLRFVNRERYKNKKELFDRSFANQSQALFVDEGGKSIYALPGCREIIYEMDTEVDHVLLPVGSGTTLAGIIQGLAEKFPRTQAHGIVVLKGAQYLNQEVEQLAGSGWNNYVMHHDFHAGGFAKGLDEVYPVINDFYTQTGISTEYIYTGKMIRAALHMLEKGFFKAGQSVVLIHTGGVWE